MKERDLINKYRNADERERVNILMDNYSVFSKELRKAEKKIIYMIKADREFIRSHNRGNCETRVQTSVITNPTESEAIENALLEEAFNTGKIDERFLASIEEAEVYREDIRMIGIMRMDYGMLSEIVEALEDNEFKIIRPILMRESSISEMARKEDITYVGFRKRLDKIKEKVREELFECLSYKK